MKRGVLFLVVGLVILGAVASALRPGVLRADEIQELQKQINELEALKKQSEAATKPLESELVTLEQRIRSARAGIAAAKVEAQEREEDLATQYVLLAGRVAQQYKRSRTLSPLMLLFTSSSASDLTKNLAYSSSVQEQDNRMIRTFSEQIFQLEEDQKTLAALEVQLEGQATFFAGEIEKARSYQQNLAGQIASLTARQDQIIAARSGGFTFKGDSELADDYNASIKGFREQAPSGYFAVFSFGAYSHRNGMSQYGALGRASQGQNAEQILSAYYPGKELKKDYSEPGSIRVRGQGISCFVQPDGTYNKYYDEEVDFQKYLKGIHEVPQSWPAEVLKAQAVAARTYAIRIGGPIQPNQNHQVYKDCEKGGGWPSAVEQTKNWVLLDGGSPAFTEYSSTAGGWSKTSGWDTTDGAGGGNFIDKAYEKLGGSPWLYKAWYTEGTGVNSAKCGRSNPWLSPQEMADIVNAVIALKTPGIDTSRITPVTTSCWGGNPYSMDELRNLVSGHGGISSATSVTVSQGNGITNSVTINGVNMTPVEFRKAFNLRAPGYVSIRQSPGVYGSPFFNIEKK